MSVLSDKTIRNLALEEDMISPFIDNASKGWIKFLMDLVLLDYDARVGDEFKIFT